MEGFRGLVVSQLAYKLAMEIFEESKSFPKEERYSLTDQLRRSSRSVVANIAKGYRKRQYPNMLASLQTQMQKQPKRKCGSILRAIVVT